MRSLQTAVFPVLPYGYQFSCEKRHHINWVFLRGEAEEDPAYVGSNAEIHLVGMFPLGFPDDSAVYHRLSQVISYKTAPDFLHNKFWFV